MATMEWHRVLEMDDLWEGDMADVEVGAIPILLVNVDGEVRAYDNRCPHQATRLSEGDLDGEVLTCRAHLWEFNARTGAGINPHTARLPAYPVRVEDGAIYVGMG